MAYTQQIDSHLAALWDGTQALAKGLSSSALFERLCGICLQRFDCQQASLMVLESDGAYVRVVAAAGHLYPALVQGARVKVGESVAGWVAEHAKPMLLGAHIDPSQFNDFVEKRVHLSAAMVVPILAGGHVIGVLNVSHRDSDKPSYDQEELGALKAFSWVVAAAIQQATGLLPAGVASRDA